MQYVAPIRDIQFVMHELLDSQSHYSKLSAYAELDTDTINSYLEATADFAQSVIAPLNRTGDIEGCQFNHGVVTTPTGLRRPMHNTASLVFLRSMLSLSLVAWACQYHYQVRSVR